MVKANKYEELLLYVKCLPGEGQTRAGIQQLGTGFFVFSLTKQQPGFNDIAILFQAILFIFKWKSRQAI